MRGTLLFLLTKIDPVIIFFVIVFLLQLIGNYVFSGAINIITLITTRKYYGT